MLTFAFYLHTLFASLQWPHIKFTSPYLLSILKNKLSKRLFPAVRWKRLSCTAYSLWFHRSKPQFHFNSLINTRHCFFFRWSRCREGEKFKCCDEEVLTHSSTLITTFCLVSTDRVKWCRMEGSLYAIPSLNSLTLLLDCFSCQELD